MAQALTFSHVSDQSGQHLHARHYEIPSPGTEEVLVRMLVAPINPQDIMVLAGKYPVKPANHLDGEAIPGYDGVAEILQCGQGVTKFQVGERVIPKQHGLGTWRTHAVFSQDSLLTVSSRVDPKLAGILRMCVAPAYLLLEDMKQLRPGDWIIQNAASGTIAQMVTQFAKLKGLHTISIIRDHADALVNDDWKKKLQAVGADMVLTEAELAATNSLSKDRRILLALDSVFGPQAAAMATHLSPNALFVNYGCLGGSTDFEMSQELLFWKQLTFRNFRLSTCLGSRSEAEIGDMLAWFVQLAEDGAITAAEMDTVVWDSGMAKADMDGVGWQLMQAVTKAGHGKKPVFVFT